MDNIAKITIRHCEHCKKSIEERNCATCMDILTDKNAPSTYFIDHQRRVNQKIMIDTIMKKV